jgi:acetyltransferase-like isoleucine patch superfamily enzyme
MEKSWEKPTIEHGKLTKYNFLVSYPDNLELEFNVDIGEFTYINSHFGVKIRNDVQIGSHCSIYSHSTIDSKQGMVILEKNCKIGTHSTIMPNVTIGENSIIGAYSFVTSNVPANELWVGIPAKFKSKLT